MTMQWQVDFYRRPLQSETGQPLWELVVCDAAGELRYWSMCPQSEANSQWSATELRSILTQTGITPEALQVFRPQSLSIIQAAAQTLGITVEPTRHTPALKAFLQQRSQDYPGMAGYTGQSYDPLALDSPPPTPLPEELWGDRWRFASLPAGELDRFRDRPIPIVAMPDALMPFNLKLSSTLAIPGVVIDGGRQSMRLARWLKDENPAFLNYIPGDPDGLILEAGLVDHWVVATFDDPEVKTAAQTFRSRQQASQGVHFLLIQPDDSGMTYSGFWLLRQINLNS
ncbi:Tab2/Atab2 family RNA-binding protein [Microcoleus sp. FACHB-1515]|uniref:Tab2/Atab2 family RNA-binding protein n=2 Tax=Cyanophyceae TaxID=3028117 RepID=UPI0037C4EFF2